MKFLTNTITILSEIAALILSIIWYINTRDIEPLISIIVTGTTLLVSILMKLTARPRIVMHYEWTHSGRKPQGYTNNNPSIIRVGIDHPEMFWRLNWDYDLEIRNNSSFTAYNIQIKYINLPPRTSVEGNFGKIEPFHTHEVRKFSIRIVQNVTGTHIDADKYLNDNPIILTEKFHILIKYTDENQFPFSTTYYWTKDKNKFGVF